jgi:hypothetical protein
VSRPCGLLPGESVLLTIRCAARKGERCDVELGWVVGGDAGVAIVVAREMSFVTLMVESEVGGWVEAKPGDTLRSFDRPAMRRRSLFGTGVTMRCRSTATRL